MNTGCEFYSDALVDLAADRLEPERAERIEAHVAMCQDCQAALTVIRAVREAPAPMPRGLEGRLRVAAQGDEPVVALETPERGRPRPGRSWRPWALPVAVAAALAVWLGGEILSPAGPPSDGEELAEVDSDYPYGAWPGSSGVVAGEVVLSELSVEELEALLEEIDS